MKVMKSDFKLKLFTPNVTSTAHGYNVSTYSLHIFLHYFADFKKYIIRHLLQQIYDFRDR